MISFIESSTPLEQVRHEADDTLPSWYHSHSLVFVAPDHPVWSKKRQTSRRYGNVSKTDTSSVSQMLVEARDQVVEVLAAETEEWRIRNPVTDTESGQGRGGAGPRRRRGTHSSEDSLSSLADDSFELKMADANVAAFGSTS